MAGEVHAHGLVAREDEAQACPDEEGGNEEYGNGCAEVEKHIGEDDDSHANPHQSGKVTAVNKPPGGHAVDDKARGDEGVEPAATAKAELFCIEGDVVGHGAVGETDENEIYKLGNGAGEKKSIKGKGSVRLLFAGLHFQCGNENETDYAQSNCRDEDDGIAQSLVQEHPGHGARGECQVHADAKVADAFATTAGGEGIDGHRIACGAGNAEGKPVGKP